MTLFLRLTAAGIAFVSVVFWLFGGPNLGWTRWGVKEPGAPLSSEPFAPGLDFMAGALAVSVLLLAVSAAVRRRERRSRDGSGKRTQE